MDLLRLLTPVACTNLTVRGAAAIPSNIRGTSAVPTSRVAGELFDPHLPWAKRVPLRGNIDF